MPMTRQQIFNTAYHGLAAQGFAQSSKPSEYHGGQNQCLYRGPNGKRCALGYCIPDSIYNPEFDGKDQSSIRALMGRKALGNLFNPADVQFLVDLQYAHDTAPVSPAHIKQRIEDVAIKYDLTIPVLPVRADAPVQEEVKEHEHEHV